jgi:glycosyltransferase involved in cell wall biosynthesis
LKILLDNVNVDSSSGPNSFGKKLMVAIGNLGHEISCDVLDPDVQLSFISTSKKKAKLALRLDGIYFNSKQDWRKLNEPIKSSFSVADIAIFQSNFNKSLTEKYFGEKQSVVIGNGTCLESIKKIRKLENNVLDRFDEVWCCSSSWRPHKRLRDNIGYFLENAPERACMVVAGENPDFAITHPRILFAGQLPWEVCISLYKRAKYFVHLAFLDHCPNVVVDARAAGCNIIVSSSGGTKEIAGIDATIVEDVEWDYKPLELYSPPALDYSRTYKNIFDSNIDINHVASRYISTLEKL